MITVQVSLLPHLIRHIVRLICDCDNSEDERDRRLTDHDVRSVGGRKEVSPHVLADLTVE